MDSSPDQTLLNLVGVHRFEVNQLEADLALANQNLASSRFVSDANQAEVKRLKGDVDRLRGDLRTARDHHAAKETERQGVLESLKLDLGNEREAHTALRDTTRELERRLRAALTELVTHGDLTPGGKRKLEQILGGE